MYFMRPILLVCMMMTVVACSTAAQRKAAAIKHAIAPAAAAGNACVARAALEYKDLAARMPLDGGDPSLSQQASVDLVSPSEARSLVAWRDEISKCRANFMKVLYQTIPTVADVNDRIHLKIENIFLALLQRRITWGEAVSQLASVRAELKHEMLEAARQVDTELAIEDAAERAQRAEAIAAVGNAMASAAQAMQPVRTTIQPVTTNCTRFFNNISRTSY